MVHAHAEQGIVDDWVCGCFGVWSGFWPSFYLGSSFSVGLSDFPPII